MQSDGYNLVGLTGVLVESEDGADLLLDKPIPAELMQTEDGASGRINLTGHGRNARGKIDYSGETMRREVAKMVEIIGEDIPAHQGFRANSNADSFLTESVGALFANTEVQQGGRVVSSNEPQPLLFAIAYGDSLQGGACPPVDVYNLDYAKAGQIVQKVKAAYEFSLATGTALDVLALDLD